MKHLLTFLLLFPMWLSGQDAYFVKSGSFKGKPEVIARLTNGGTYSVAQLVGASVDFIPSSPATVKFALTGRFSWNQTESVAPYLLFGNSSTSISKPPKPFTTGQYVLKATTGSNTTTFTFYVVESIPTRDALRWYGFTSDSVFLRGIMEAAPTTGKFTVVYGADSVTLSWAGTPIEPDPIPDPIDPIPDPEPDPEPIDTVIVPPYTGTSLRYDSARHGFLDPDGDYIPDVRKVGVHWSRLDTAKWVPIPVPAGASEATINGLIAKADAATPGGVLLFPSGTFSMSKIVLKAATNVIFRGSGRGVTNLKFTAVQSGTACIYGSPTDPGARHNATVGTPAWSNRITIGSSSINGHSSLYQPGKYVWVRSEVPPFWAEKYRQYFNNGRMWHYETCLITKVNASEGWFEVEDEFPMSMETNLKVQPLVPCVGIGFENMTITSPDIGSTGVYSQVIQLLRAYDCWGTKLTFEQPLGYALDFPESSHCEFTYSLVKEAPKHLLDLGARAYGGLMGCSHTLLDSIEYRGCRHSLLTQDGISQCLMDRIVSKNSDTHTPHTGFMFHSVISRYWNQKGTNGMPTTWIFGVHPDNTQHYGGPISCYSYRVKMDGAPTQNSNRGLKFGMEDGNVISHAQMEFSLNQNAAYTPAIQVWNLAFNVVLKHSKIVVPPEKVQAKYVGRQRLIDIVPGDVYKYTDPKNGRYYPLKQTGWTTYPGISNGQNNGGEYFSGSEVMLPGVPSNYSVKIYDLEVFGIPQSKWFEGFDGARPTWSDIRETTDRNVIMPEGFKGIPSIYEAQKAYK